MSERLAAYRRRLAKVERQLAVIARRSELANCNCDKTTRVVVWSEELEAVRNVRCPAHGFRRIGVIAVIEYIGPDGKRVGRGEYPIGAFSRESRLSLAKMSS